MLSKSIVQPTVLSEMKDKFRGLRRPPLAPPEITVKAPDPEYISDVSMLGTFFIGPHLSILAQYKCSKFSQEIFCIQKYEKIYCVLSTTAT